MKRGNQQLRTATEESRGVSPQVGLIILFGMVAVGAVLVVISGTVLIDSVSSESKAEATRTQLDVANQGISTTVMTGEDQSIPWNDANYRDSGEAYLAWYDNSSNVASNPGNYTDTTVHIETLGSIEYALDDRTIAYQGGGQWEKRGGQTTVLSPPSISYDGESLQLRLVQVDEDDVQGREATVQLDQSDGLSERIASAQANASNQGYDNIALIIESEYHDGWESHFRSALPDNNNVSIDPSEKDPLIGGLGGEDTIQVTIEGAMDFTPAMFWVEEDLGVAGNSTHAQNNRFIHKPGKDLEFAATFENTGDEEQTQEVGVTIKGIGIEANRSITLSGGDSKTLSKDSGTKDPLSIPESQYFDELTFGETYEYKLSTEDDNSHSGGMFYYAKRDDPYLNISNPTIEGIDASDPTNPVEATDNNVTVEVDVHNIGGTSISNAPSFTGELELTLDVPNYNAPSSGGSWYDSTTTTVDRDFGENATATWELNRSRLLEAEHEFTVTSTENGESVTGHFVVDTGVDVKETELYLNPNTNVSVSFVGSELSTHGGGRNSWLPTFVDIFTQPVDDNGNSVGDRDRHDQSDGVDWADTNINTHDSRLDILEYNFTTNERVSLMLQATSYQSCYETEWWGPWSVRSDRWEYQGQEDGYEIYDCPTGYEQNQLVDLTAETDTEESNVRVLNETRNTMPQLEPGIDVQMRADELLDRNGVDVPVVENNDSEVFDGEGYNLQLDENEFVFLFELTHHPEQNNNGPRLDSETDWTNQRYWNESFNRQDGDPNFNDVIAHVEIDQAETPEDTELDGIFQDENGRSVTVGTGNSTLDEERSGSRTEVDVGTDAIIIG